MRSWPMRVSGGRERTRARSARWSRGRRDSASEGVDWQAAAREVWGRKS